MTEAQLQQLRASWQAKHAEATAIINDPNATGERLTAAEKLFDERDALGKDLDAAIAEGKRADALRGRKSAGEAWLSEPQRTLPFAAAGHDGAHGKGAGKFTVSGMEDAGRTVFGIDRKSEVIRILEEAGPGTLGQKTWDAIQSPEYRREFALYIRKGVRYLDGSKALQESMDDQGGVTAPAEFIARVVGRLPAPTMLRSKVNTLTTGRDTLILPRKQYSADDLYTTAFRASWTGEIPADGTGASHAVNDSALLGNVEIPVHTAMLSAPVTRNLIEDSAFPIQSWLESELNQVIDLLYEDMITKGSGIGQPTGIWTGAGTAVNPIPTVLSGAAAGLAYDGIIDLETDLAPQYTSADSCVFAMNKKSTYRALCKIKDGNQRPIFARGVTEDGLVNPRAMTLEGYPVVFAQFAPNVGASNYPLLFGDLKGYYLAQRVGFSIQVLDQTKAKANQIELVGRVRFGGKVVEPWRMRLQKSNNS